MKLLAIIITCGLALGLSRPTFADQMALYVDLTGQPSHAPFVTNGNANAAGLGIFEFDDSANTMNWDIQLTGNPFAVTQAHFYNINPTSSFYKVNGESIFCWGGRWSNHDFLSGDGFAVSGGRIANIIANPQDWMLMLHTEGGHFANEGGGLIPYNASIHETNDIGVAESGNWFNNRIGKRLDDLTLREDNPHFTADNTFLENMHGSGYFNRQSNTAYSDAIGNTWVESDGNGGWQLTAAAVSAGYDLNTQYLFYRYADDGNSWDYGASEGALGGVLQVAFPVPEPASIMLVCVGVIAALNRRRAS